MCFMLIVLKNHLVKPVIICQRNYPGSVGYPFVVMGKSSDDHFEEVRNVA